MHCDSFSGAGLRALFSSLSFVLNLLASSNFRSTSILDSGLNSGMAIGADVICKWPRCDNVVSFIPLLNSKYSVRSVTTITGVQIPARNRSQMYSSCPKGTSVGLSGWQQGWMESRH